MKPITQQDVLDFLKRNKREKFSVDDISISLEQGKSSVCTNLRRLRNRKYKCPLCRYLVWTNHSDLKELCPDCVVQMNLIEPAPIKWTPIEDYEDSGIKFPHRLYWVE